MPQRAGAASAARRYGCRGMAERRLKGEDSARATRGTAPSAANIKDLEKFEASDEAKRHQPSDVDAMGRDKRREVVGHSYGPSARSQIMFFVAVGAVVVVIVGGWLGLVALFDKPPTHYKDAAPWAATAANASPRMSLSWATT